MSLVYVQTFCSYRNKKNMNEFCPLLKLWSLDYMDNIMQFNLKKRFNKSKP